MSAFSSRNEPSFRRSFLIIGVYVLLVVISDSRQEEQQLSSTTNQNVEINNTHDIKKFNNHKVKNYNYHENKYQPHSQVQVYINVPKEKKLRVSRPPSVEEFALKQRIMQVYEAALDEIDEPTNNLIHLGRIIKALNPKYIATQRVMRVAFADPNDPDVSVNSPESEVDSPQLDSFVGFGGHDDGGLVQSTSLGPDDGHLSPVLSLSSESATPIVDQLEDLEKKFTQLISWDQKFAMKLTQMDEKQLQPKLIAFKRLVQCVAFKALCYFGSEKKAKKQEQLQPVTYGDDHLKVSVPVIMPVKVDFKAPRVAALGPAASNRRVAKSTAPAEPQEVKKEEEVNVPGEEYFKTFQSAAPRPVQQQQTPIDVVDKLDENYDYGYGYGSGYNPIQQDYLTAESQFEAQPQPEPETKTFYGPTFPDSQQGQFAASPYNTDLSQRLQRRFGPFEGQQEQQQQQEQPVRPIRNARFRSKLRRAPAGY